jgi:LDH2 family malate/lactate/ureidoglycolate dehydrogenase
MGISALRLAVSKGCELMKEGGTGMAAIGVVNCSHTGRIGVFAEEGANRQIRAL